MTEPQLSEIVVPQAEPDHPHQPSSLDVELITATSVEPVVFPKECSATPPAVETMSTTESIVGLSATKGTHSHDAALSCTPRTYDDTVTITTDATPATDRTTSLNIVTCSSPLPQLRPTPDASPTGAAVSFAKEAPPATVLATTPLTTTLQEPQPVLDLQIGTWRDVWPNDISVIISVDHNLLVRYFRSLRKIDLIRIGSTPTGTRSGGAFECTVCDSFWVTSLPNIASLHHFAVGSGVMWSGATAASDGVTLPAVSPSPVPHQPAGNAAAAASRATPTVMSGAAAWSGNASVNNSRPVTSHEEGVKPTTTQGTTHKVPPSTTRNCVLCVADDMKRCLVFGLMGDRIEQLGATSLPIKATHVVPFVYRGIHYFLTYHAPTGDYGVIPFVSLMGVNGEGGGTPQLVARGQFRPGWTDVLWKGTHHVRCTRQKFFCYNHDSGETVFECVWVRGASGSSSVCSAEHVTMPASPRRGSSGGRRRGSASNNPNPGGPQSPTSPRSSNDEELQTALHRRACLVIPLQVGGTFAAMLYSHSRFTTRRGSHAGGLLLQRRQSSGRMLVDAGSRPGSGGPGATGTSWVTQSTTIVDITTAASLMLRKRVYAHEEPWTHFCMLSDNLPHQSYGAQTQPQAKRAVVASAALLLCYSSVSGEVWINSLYWADPAAVQRDVTVCGSESDPSGTPRGYPIAASKRPTNGATQDAQAAAQAAWLGVDVHGFAKEQANRRSPFDHPVDPLSNLDSMQLEHSGRLGGTSRSGTYTAHAPRAYRSDSRWLVISSAGAHRVSSAGADTDSPFGQAGRPSSSRQSLRERLMSLPHATGDYHKDIAAVIDHISVTDFGSPEVPYSRIAQANVPKLPRQDPRLQRLVAEYGNQSGKSDTALSSPSAPRRRTQSARVVTSSGHSPPRQSVAEVGFIAAPPSPPRDPWRPSAAAGVTIPAPPQSPTAKFERDYRLHVKHDVPSKLSQDEKVTQRLFRGGVDERTLYQQRALEQLSKDEERAQVGQNADPKHVSKTIEKLGVGDVEQRRKRQKERDAQQTAIAAPALHRGSRALSPEEIRDAAERLHDRAVATRDLHLADLKKKLLDKEASTSATFSPKLCSRPGERSVSPQQPGSHRKLSPPQQRGLGERLVAKSVEHREESLRRIVQEMEDHFRHAAQHHCASDAIIGFVSTPPNMSDTRLSEDELKALTHRLHRNEKREW